jgi:hypothetical protein
MEETIRTQNSYMIDKNRSLLSKNLGKTRRSSRGSRGRRESNHHFSRIVLKDNQF